MQGSTHLLIGMTSGLLLATPASAPAMIILGGIGGLLPDIDHPQSTISRKLAPLRLLVFWIPHRTLTHSIFAAVLMLIPALLINPVLVSLWAGYTLHIAADMITKNGVPVLYPLTRLSLYLLPRPLRIVTGGFIEGVLRLAIVALFVVLITRVVPFWLAMIEHPLLQDLFNF